MKLCGLIGRNLSLAFITATLIVLGACAVKQEDKLTSPLVAQTKKQVKLDAIKS